MKKDPARTHLEQELALMQHRNNLRCRAYRAAQSGDTDLAEALEAEILDEEMLDLESYPDLYRRK